MVDSAALSQVSDSLTMELYPHQETGADWIAARKRAFLFDEQGLGKTITAIVGTDRAGAGRVLVVCPSVVLWNWAREWARWSPARSVQVVASMSDTIDTGADVVIVTHRLMFAPFIRAQLVAASWDATILDEAHFFKSHTAQRSVAFYGRWGAENVDTIVARSRRVLLLTGTPMPNNASELWTMIWGLFPDRIHGAKDRPLSWTSFRDRYCRTRPTPYGIKVIANNPERIPELRTIMDSVSLRRLKRDVLPDLPALRYETVTVRPAKMPWEIEALDAELRPALRAAIQTDEADTPELGFSALRSETDFSRWRALCGLAKLDPAVEFIQAELDAGLSKLVVFAHHKDVVRGLFEGLRSYGADVITGATSAQDRSDRVDRFQTDPDFRVIICNIVAGGTGTTLTAAAECLFVEMSFVPGENAQAADRIHRIGQKSKARIRFLALAGTVDEELVTANEAKIRMIREVLE